MDLGPTSRCSSLVDSKALHEEPELVFHPHKFWRALQCSGEHARVGESNRESIVKGIVVPVHLGQIKHRLGGLEHGAVTSEPMQHERAGIPFPSL